MPSAPPKTPPQAAILQMLYGAWVAKAVAAIAELGVPDALVAGPKSAAELAEECGADPSALSRTLRALASRAMFTQGADGRYALTPLSEVLRSDAPGSMRDYARYLLNDGTMRAWSLFDDAVRTGTSTFTAANGVDTWEFFAANPSVSERFDAAMTSLTRNVAATFARAYDWTGVTTVVDVGGGQGTLLAAVLREVPALSGILFDLPSTAARAAAHLADAGVGDRARVEAGDMFEGVPSGHDAYVMKNVLHDWDDARARAALGSVRRAIPGGGRLLLIEAVLPDAGTEPHPAKWLDLHMLVMLDGKERTEAEWRALLLAERFSLERVVPLGGPSSIIVATPT